MNYIEMGVKIRRLREEKRLTQLQLSERVGISDRELSNIEIGKVNPLFGTILAIAENLNVSLDYLVSENTDLDKDAYIHEISEQLSKMKLKEIRHILKCIQLYMDSDEHC